MNTTTATSVLEQPAPEPAQELFMIPDEVSAVLQVSRGDLRRMRDAGQGPAHFTIGSTIRYLHADVDQWCADHPHGIEIPPRRNLGEGR
jgi:predicted DNA-binding transcriptional regulator AlpA